MSPGPQVKELADRGVDLSTVNDTYRNNVLINLPSLEMSYRQVLNDSQYSPDDKARCTELRKNAYDRLANSLKGSQGPRTIDISRPANAGIVMPLGEFYSALEGMHSGLDAVHEYS